MEIGGFGQRIARAIRSIVTMTRHIALSRPATSAIAALMVLSAPAAFAQEAPTVSPTVSPTMPMSPPVAAPTVPAPGPAVSTAPVATPPAPQPVIRVPLDIAPPAEADTPKAEPKAAAAATPTQAQRAPARPRAAEPARAAAASAPVETAPVETAEAAPAAEMTAAAPLAATVPATVVPPAETMAEPVGQRATGNDAFPWEIVGGTAALLVIGGAGLAFARRRRTADEEEAFDTVFIDDARAADPVPAVPAPSPTPPSAPAFVATPAAGMGRHEAMAMAGPTPDNPFVTLRKRLVRARFLDRQDRTRYDAMLAGQKDLRRKPVSAWEVSQRPAPAPVAEQEVRRPAPGRLGETRRPGLTRG